MINTKLICETMDFVKGYYGDRVDESGRRIIDRLIWVADRMEDELTVCTALFQDYMNEWLWEWPSLPSGIPLRVYHAMNTLIYHKDREPYDSFIRHVMEDKVAASVKIVDLQYRSNPENYCKLTTELVDDILVYRNCYWMMFFHQLELDEKSCQYDERNAIKTNCCQRIVPLGYHYCPICGKRIDDNAIDHFRYGFDQHVDGIDCFYCGAWTPSDYHFCGMCGHNLYEFNKIE